MSSVYDGLIQVLLWLSSTLPGLLLLTSPIWGFLGVRASQAALRRRAFRSFAAAHGFNFIGTTSSEFREAYSNLEDVKQATALSNLIEGTWDGLEVGVFEISPRRRFPRTAVVVRLETDHPPRRFSADTHLVSASPNARALLATGPPAEVDVQRGYLFVGAMQRLDLADLPGFLYFATSLARWLVADASAVPARPGERG